MVTMRTAVCKSHVESLAVLVWLFFGLPTLPPTFAAWRKQSELRSNRENSGLNSPSIADTRARLAAEREGSNPISPEGKRLLAEIVEAGNRGDWLRIHTVMASYVGSDIQLFSCAMKFALRCGQYKVSQQEDRAGPTMFSAALLIYAKMGDAAAVHSIWAEAMESWVDIEIPHINSAIHACAQAAGNAHNAAKFLFELMHDLDLHPNIITFTSLMEAYHSAPLDWVLAAYHVMKEGQVEMDFAFAETFLCNVLQRPTEGQSLKTALLACSQARRSAAQSALEDFKASGIKLTALSSRIDDALRADEPDKGYVVGLLKGIQDRLTKTRTELDQTEKAKTLTHKSLFSAKKDQATILQNEVLQKSRLLAQSKLDLVEAQRVHDEEKESSTEMMQMVADTKEDCSSKASEFKVRKEDQQKERAALVEATAVLKEEESDSTATNFLQVASESNAKGEEKEDALRRAVALMQHQTQEKAEGMGNAAEAVLGLVDAIQSHQEEDGKRFCI
ncbi:unnamed protein product [Symbiodinium sp. CCMP2592]|nr:unnamed protein product [Symbiodinium sp. CCMP2592]